MNLNFLGSASITLACFMALFGLVASVWGAKAQREDLLQSGRRATYAVFGLLLLAVLILVRALITRDYSLEYVAEEVDASMPIYYRIAALWGGMNGSLLWWSLIAATYMAVCLWINRDRFRELMPWVTAVGCYVLFFLTLLVGGMGPLLRGLDGALGMGGALTGWECNPFTLLVDSDPTRGIQEMVARTGDGRGLNPLLQTYWMTIHPPSLYVGYIGFLIPFAFCIAALITRRVTGEFLRATRRWTLWAWMVLGFGVLLGSKWAYEELGWGGYWGWDPVENASFMPWLVATAYVHSVIIQEKRGMLKGWNVFLILLTFIMTYFGTFLTRSGVVQSVHAFGSGPIGWMLGGFIFSLVALSAYLLLTRSEQLKAENEIEAVFSREATFLYNNVGLLGFMLMVFVGTMFPVFSEAVKGNKVVVGPPFFNPLAGLITLGLFLLMGVGQLVAWRKTGSAALKKNFSVPLWVTGFAFLAFFLFLPKEPRSLIGLSTQVPLANPWAVALWTSCVFVTAGIVWEYVIGTRAVLSSHRQDIDRAWEAGKRAPTPLLIAAGMASAGIGWAIASVALAGQVGILQFLTGLAFGAAGVFAAHLAASSNRKVADVQLAVTILFLRNRRRYGGYLVHFGLVVVVAGIVGSSLYKTDETHTFKEGETRRVGEFDVTYTGLELKREPGVWRVIGFLRLEKDGKKFGAAYPEKAIFDKGEQPTTEVSIHETAVRDYYTILESFTDERIGDQGKGRTATIRFLIAPMVTWLWAGGILCVIGTGIAGWPERRRVEAMAEASTRAPVAAGPLPEALAGASRVRAPSGIVPSPGLSGGTPPDSLPDPSRTRARARESAS